MCYLCGDYSRAPLLLSLVAWGDPCENSVLKGGPPSFACFFFGPSLHFPGEEKEREDIRLSLHFYIHARARAPIHKKRRAMISSVASQSRVAVAASVRRRERRTSSARASTTSGGVFEDGCFFPSSSSSSLSLCLSREEGRENVARRDVRARAMPPPSSSSHPAETLLDESRALYEQGERMQGYKKLEQAMKLDEDASLPVRREIRYQAMCCVAAFGDVEMAKQYLREMELLGLPYDVAINDPSLMRMESSALMRNQLKKFASGSEKSFGTVQREVYERTKRTLPGGPGGDAPVVNKGLMELEIDDNTDASVGGIAKRVGGVVLASIGGFALLFFAGLKLIQESGY